MFFFTRFVFTTNTVRTKFKILKAHILIQNLIICRVKVNVSPINYILHFYRSLNEIFCIENRFFNFLSCIVSGSENALQPCSLSDTKLYNNGCLKPLTTLLSIPSHLKCIFLMLLKFFD